MNPIRTFLTSVAAVHDVHPHLRKITFAGGDLTTFEPLGPDTFLYVLLPPPGRGELGIDQSFTWDAWSAMPEHERPVGAYYTVHDWRPEAAELDLLFVLHEPSGHACRWAATARPGDRVALWGPRQTFAPPEDTEELVLVADDTGLPALAAIAAAAPPHVQVTAIVEVDNPSERLPIAERRNTAVHWLSRNGAPPGVDACRLLDAVTTLRPPSPQTYVWGGGESRAMTLVRRHVRDVWGLERRRVDLVAYWRHASTSPADVDDD